MIRPVVAPSLLAMSEGQTVPAARRGRKRPAREPQEEATGGDGRWLAAECGEGRAV